MAAMREVAEGLYLLRGTPANGINVYLMGDVIVDSGTRHAAGRILRQVRDRPVAAHALTHAHADHAVAKNSDANLRVSGGEFDSIGKVLDVLDSAQMLPTLGDRGR